MALAQQQYSSSNSVIQSAAPSSVVAMENNTTTSVPRHRTSVTPNSQRLSPQTNSPLLQQVTVASGQLVSPSKDSSESGNRGGGGRELLQSKEREQQRGEGRPGKRKERRADVSINASSTVPPISMVTRSSSDSSPIKQQTAASSSVKAEMAQQHVVTTVSPLTTVAASNPLNILLPAGTTPALTSPPMTSISPAMALGGLNLSALPTAPLTVSALSNQLLAAGLPAATITPTGISTPTLSGGLLSPILFGSNPFLTVLGSAPSLSSAAAAASQPTAASNVLQATAATLNQPAAQAGTNLGGINLQLIKQLQEKISAHLQAIPNSGQRGGDISSAGAASMLATAPGGLGRTPLQQALLASGIDPGLSKRERLLESLLMSKTPVYCIASPPEVLVSDASPSEHTIEYIDTQRKTSSSRRSSGNESRCSQNEPVKISGSGGLDQKETAKRRRDGPSYRTAAASQSLTSSNMTEATMATSFVRDSVSNSSHLLGSPLNSLTIAHSLLSKPTPTTSSQAATVTAGGIPPVLTGLSLSATPSSSLSLPGTTTQIQQTAAGLPLLSYAAAVPRTTVAALTPTLSSPLKGYYIMLNPLATAAAGAAAAGGATAVQPIMIAAAASGTAAASPTVCGGTTAIQVPAALTPAAASLNLPSLATSLNSPAVPSPMFCYLPAAAAGVDGSYNHLTAVQTAAVNPALTAQAAVPLAAVSIGGAVEAEKDKELERSCGIPTSLQMTRAKKRLGNDSIGLNEAKRIRVDTEGIQVDSEEEGGAIEYVTASESDDEGTDKMSVHGSENYKPSGCKY